MAVIPTGYNAAMKIVTGGDCAPTFVDIDADGDLDCFLGENSGIINYLENIGTATVAVFDIVVPILLYRAQAHTIPPLQRSQTHFLVLMLDLPASLHLLIWMEMVIWMPSQVHTTQALTTGRMLATLLLLFLWTEPSQV